MAYKLYNDTDIQNIANSIRAKAGTSSTYTVSEMSAAIDAIPGGGTPEPTPPATPTNAVIFYSLSSFTLHVGDRTKRWNGTIQYSTNNSSYSTWDGTTTLSAAKDTTTDYYVLYIRGINNTSLVRGNNPYAYWKAISTGENIIKCCGNLNKLLNYSTDVTSIDSYCFSYLFFGNSNMDFDITLPATTLATYCYLYMFSNCTSLTKAPALPATTLAAYCYQNMFSNCTSLTKAPALPATTLAAYCYLYMFSNCPSLTKAPALPATTLAGATYCYQNMFSNCPSLTKAPALPATTLANNCYLYMFSNCTSLTEAPTLPATRLFDNCYAYMFSGCTSLIEAPTLPATTLAKYCYNNMFSKCISLTEIPALPATTLANYCYGNMFSYCLNIKISTSQTGIYLNAYRIPTEGTGTTASSAFSSMFSGTGGTFKGTPSINTTYYTSNTIV